jgi:mono/diheme cytochrome c family protein
MDANGKFPPPPLNGSAHAWHHPQQVLVDTIKNGTAKLGGNMPAWKGKLSEQDIRAIIAWFQSKWSDEIYAAWYENNQLSKNRK